VPCAGCARTFNPDSLEVHQRGCKEFKVVQKKAEELEPVKVPQRPKALVCYICGRQYGTSSLGIHIKACQKSWEVEQSKLPVNERRKCPSPPKILAEQPDRPIVTSKAMQEYNEEAFQSFNEKALEPCPHCARTFLPSSLKVHLRSCKPKEAKV
jgi:hypothetical protein